VQGPLPALTQTGRRRVLGVGAAVVLLALSGGARAQSPAPANPPRAQAALSADVPAGRHKVLRLRNLPRDAQVAVAIQSTGRVTVSFLGEADFKRFPQPEEPLFVAPVERSLSFAVTMPATGDYYVVFDNCKGTEAQKVKMVIRAARGAGAPGPSRPLDPQAPQHEM
jgi:hypothetical protein